MSKHTADTIRNVALAGQRGAGKTSLAEMLLFTGKSIGRLGRVDDGTSTCDFDPDEVQRKMTISTAVAPVEWGKVKVNLLDTPGYSDFVGDVAGAMAVAEAALIVVDAVGGVEVGTETGWDYSRGCMTRAFFINKMDRENADFYRVLGALRERFGNKVVALQMPIGSEDSFEGVVDLVHMMAFKWEGGKMTEGDVPADLADRAQELRESLIEAAAESSDELIEKYFFKMKDESRWGYELPYMITGILNKHPRTGLAFMKDVIEGKQQKSIVDFYNMHMIPDGVD